MSCLLRSALFNIFSNARVKSSSSVYVFVRTPKGKSKGFGDWLFDMFTPLGLAAVFSAAFMILQVLVFGGAEQIRVKSRDHLQRGAVYANIMSGLVADFAQTQNHLAVQDPQFTLVRFQVIGVHTVGLDVENHIRVGWDNAGGGVIGGHARIQKSNTEGMLLNLFSRVKLFVH